MSSRAAPAIIAIILSATSSCRQSSRSAEQRCPAERNAEATTSSVTCSGKAVASTIIALTPPVSAINAAIGPSFAASARLIDCRCRRRAGEGDARDAGQGDERRAGFAVAGNEVQHIFGNAAAMQQRDGLRRDQRRLFGRFRQHAIAGDKRRGDLAEENGERKIPRADADENAAPRDSSSLLSSPVGPGIVRGALQRWRAPAA